MKKILKKISHVLPDKAYISLRYKTMLGTWPNFKEPKTFNEKLQWIKLYDRKTEYTMMVDKYEVKTYIADQIGEEYLIPTIGIWDSFEEIDFEKLPKRFVLKCTHNSGGLVICQDKETLDIEEAKRKIQASLKENYYWHSREWPYKDVKPRIIAEKYMENEDGSNISDYKIQCFNGKADNILVCAERYSATGVKYCYFDKDWNYLPYSNQKDVEEFALKLEPPKLLSEMLEIAEKLSKGIPALRVDLYEIQGKVYFGELTFFPGSGIDKTITPEADQIMGSKLKLK